MRKFLPVFAAAFLFVGLSLVARADEGKEVTVEGDGVCAKCSLKETKVCQNVVKVEKDGKTTTYYLAANDLSKKYHGSSGICTGTVKTKVTGVCKKDGEKLVITATKIEKVD
ncbi:MAG: DUF6370 family protein [Isosphaeraceae bacterium]|nr:DUF6370 family protein [Isosphaeraceae bacterium]